jgi:membrane protease YdiL (CAAX protease family)
VIIALVLSVVYYPIFLYYLNIMRIGIVTIYSIFLDVVWYPIYEEVTYRSFVFSHFAKLDRSYLSLRNFIVNVFQTFLFLSIHKHHFSTPLILLPVFFLGLVNGFLFLKTRNIYGCIVSHATLNGFALLLKYLFQTAP